MHERVKMINKYYTNLKFLEYKQKNETMAELHVIKEIWLNDDKKVNVSCRITYAIELIKRYLNFFKSLCEHIDEITNLLDYLYHICAVCCAEVNNDALEQIVFSMMYTISSYGITYDNIMELLLEPIIVPKSTITPFHYYKKVTLRCFDVILFEDSDLYAVFNYLKFKNVTKSLDNIWIQKSIVQTFKWYFKKYFGDLNISIVIFQSKEELIDALEESKQKPAVKNIIKIVSIWSEDIISAKNLAESLKQFHIIFLNMHMDICPSIIFPYAEMYYKSLENSLHLNEVDKYIYVNVTNSTAHNGLTYNLFYDGTWQIPVNNSYWIHNNVLLGNAMREDLIKCADSATKGFENWSSMSNKSRMRILFNFARTLEYEGKMALAEIILYWIKLSYISGSLSHAYQNERFELIKSRIPQGTIILKEKDEATLFCELTLSLIFGNSVIVICDPDLCTLAPYCEMLKISEIPSGVINLLSSQNTNFRYDTIFNSSIQSIYYSISNYKYTIITHT